MIAQAADPDLVGYIATFCGMPGIAFVAQFTLAFSRLKQKRLITSTPTSKIKSAAQGLAEIKGHICPDKTQEINAPLSGKPCYWFSFEVEKLERYYDSKGRSQDRKRRQNTRLFLSER